MCYEVRTTVVHVPVTRLRESPKNRLLHSDIDFHGRDSLLLDDIQQHGILLPLIVLPDYEVKDGHRRLAAAKKAGLAVVPCLIAESGDGDAMFTSAQLARHLSLFAKCVLHRELIEGLIARTEAVRQANLKFQDRVAENDAEAVETEWIRTVEALGASRRFLAEGVRLLAHLEGMHCSVDPAIRERAGRALQIFRNRGLKPALRLLGESDNVGDDGEPDVIEWQHNDADDAPAKPKAEKPAKAAAGDKPATIPMAGNWKTIGLRYVADLRALLIEHKADTQETDRACAALNSAFRGKAERAAA